MRRRITLFISGILIIIMLLSASSCGIVKRSVEEVLRESEKEKQSTKQVTSDPEAGKEEPAETETTGKRIPSVITTESTTRTGSGKLPVNVETSKTNPDNSVQPTNTDGTTAPNETTDPSNNDDSENDNGTETVLYSMEDILKNGPAIDRLEQFDPKFIEDGLEYFTQIAGGNEFDPSMEFILRKRDPNSVIKIQMLGDPQEDDYAVMNKMLPVVSKLTGLQFEYTENANETNMAVHIVPLKDFQGIFGDYYVENNWGFINYFWDEEEVINDARMAVSNDYPNRREMNHLIQEEFIQGLGLPNDSYWYSDSLFQQDWTDVQEPAPIDWLLLEFVYRPELVAGMPVEEAQQILRTLYLK